MTAPEPSSGFASSFTRLDRFDEIASVWDLSQPMFEEMPIHPRHPGYMMSLRTRHGDSYRKDGYSAANDLIIMCGHHGTHVDALGHVSINGCLHGGVSVEQGQSGRGLSSGDIASTSAIVGRGLLIDAAGLRGLNALSPDAVITVDEVEQILAIRNISPRPGDIYLFRSGWGQYWDRPKIYYPQDGCPQPGPNGDVGRWLSAHGARAAGADTMAFEHYETGRNTMPCHTELLFKSGINIIENLNLEDIAAANVAEFLFVASPLKMRGATGSPVRPIAIGAS
ncbi:MAG TPA: cyclase family protein [Acidimicrobiales bacterium]|nr:cyclase family protein [Acidimicrobiales bacterium]